MGETKSGEGVDEGGGAGRSLSSCWWALGAAWGCLGLLGAGFLGAGTKRAPGGGRGCVRFAWSRAAAGCAAGTCANASASTTTSASANNKRKRPARLEARARVARLQPQPTSPDRARPPARRPPARPPARAPAGPPGLQPRLWNVPLRRGGAPPLVQGQRDGPGDGVRAHWGAHRWGGGVGGEGPRAGLDLAFLDSLRLF